MAFSTILIGTLCLYAVYYAANIIFDLFLSSPKAEVRFDSEEEIEISEDENALSLSSYDAVYPSPSDEGEQELVSIIETQEESTTTSFYKEEEQPLMNGGMDIDTIVAHVQHSSHPDELHFVATNWS